MQASRGRMSQAEEQQVAKPWRGNTHGLFRKRVKGKEGEDQRGNGVGVRVRSCRPCRSEERHTHDLTYSNRITLAPVLRIKG